MLHLSASQLISWNTIGCNVKLPWLHLEIPGLIPSSSPNTHTHKALGVLSLSHVIMPPVWSDSVASWSIRKLSEWLTGLFILSPSLIIFLSWAKHDNHLWEEQMEQLHKPGLTLLLWLRKALCWRRYGRCLVSHARHWRINICHYLLAFPIKLWFDELFYLSTYNTVRLYKFCVCYSRVLGLPLTLVM